MERQAGLAPCRHLGFFAKSWMWLMEVAGEPQLRAHRGSRPQEQAVGAPRPPPRAHLVGVSRSPRAERQAASSSGSWVLQGSGRGAALWPGGWERRPRPSAWRVATRGAGRCGRDQGGLLPPGRPRPPGPGVSPRPAGRAALSPPPLPRAATGASGAGSARRRRSAPPGAPSPDPACVPTRTVTPPLRPPLRPASCSLRPRRRGARESTEPASAPGPPPARPPLRAPWTPRSRSPTAGTPRATSLGAAPKTSSTSPSSSIMTI